jgi:hypothetical protein
VSHFIGIELYWTQHSDGNVSVTLTQQSFAETLIESLGITMESKSTFTSPYCSDYPIDAIATQ